MTTAVSGFASSLHTFLLKSPSIRARLARNLIWSIVGSASSQGAALLTAFVVARTLGVTLFGELALLQATVLMMGSLGEMGFTLTTTKFVSHWRLQDPARTGRLIGWSFRFTAVAGIGMALVFVSGHSYLGISRAVYGHGEVYASCLWMVSEMLNKNQLGALAGLEAFGLSAWVHTTRGVLMLPVVWLATRAGGLLGAVLGFAAVSAISVLVGQIILHRVCRPLSIKIRFSGKIEPGILRTSMSMWASGLMLTGTAWLAAFMLSRNPNGMAEVGLYNAADKLRVAMLFLPTMLFQVSLPMLSNSHASGDTRSCRRILSASLAAAIGVTGPAALVAASFSSLLMSSYGSAFAAGGMVLKLSAAGAVVSAVYTVASGALWALGKPSQMLAIDLFKSAIFVGMCWMGLASSAYNLMIAYMAAFAVGSAAVLAVLRTKLKPVRIEVVRHAV